MFVRQNNIGDGKVNVRVHVHGNVTGACNALRVDVTVDAIVGTS